MSLLYLTVLSFDVLSDAPLLALFQNAIIRWGTYFENVLPASSDAAVTVVLENTCDGEHTYLVKGTSVDYLGKGNLADQKFQFLQESGGFPDAVDLNTHPGPGYPLNEDLCEYKISVYPTQAYYDDHHTQVPMIITLAVAIVFFISAIVYFIYDRLVEHRNRKVMSTAVRSTAIVSSLFPHQIRGRLFEEEQAEVQGTKTRLRSFLADGNVKSADEEEITEQGVAKRSKPIADLFPATTILVRSFCFFFKK